MRGAFKYCTWFYEWTQNWFFNVLKMKKSCIPAGSNVDKTLMRAGFLFFVIFGIGAFYVKSAIFGVKWVRMIIIINKIGVFGGKVV